MGNPRHIGARHIGRARPPVGDAAARTSVLRAEQPPPPPVFVDATGERRRRLRRLTVVLLVLALLSVLGFWLSQLGASVRPTPVAPCASPPSAGGPCRR